ncbi:MAG: serine/threonine protein kinase [Polyangiaceae bacterium]|nr:serine/threonine protein kinase [Polyangiaceae bacterium]
MVRLSGTPYELVRPLGEGGIGEVYEARHVELGAPRAVKVLRRGLSGQRAVRVRFAREARILAQLRHPHLVEVLDLGESDDGRPFLAMELLTGRTLRDVLHERGALRVDRAVEIAAAILSALSEVHAHGVVHRDVKPENVMLLAGRGVKLLDFGVARVEAGDELTAVGASVGTPRYMAPEQARGEPVDPRADVWAVAALVWEMVAGEPPHADLDGVAAAALTAERGLPLLEGAPGPLAELVYAATRPDPRDRPATAGELREKLLAAVGIVADDSTTASFSLEPTALIAAAPPVALSVEPPAPPVEPTPDAPVRAPARRREWPIIAVAAALAFAVVVALAAVAAGTLPRPSPPSASQPAAPPASSVPPEVRPSEPPPVPPPPVSAAAPARPPRVAPTAHPPARPSITPRAPRPPDDLPPSGF